MVSPRAPSPRPVRLATFALLVSLLVVLGDAGGAGAQEARDASPDAAVARSEGLIRAGEFAEAARILERVTAEEPENARAWSLLGASLQSMGELDRAIRAHRRAAGFDETAPRALYALGMAHALKGEADEAFTYLFRALATGRFDMTRVAFDPDSESLRHDPRYLRLFPTDLELADPFREPVTVLQEWVGEAPGDQFGWIARNVGDVDGDGIADVTTSAPTHATGDGAAAGKVYVFSGATGAPLWSVTGEPGDRLGLGLEAAGDVDADGIPDVGAGAPGGGRALVLSGTDGSVIHEFRAEGEGEFYGRGITDVGDADGDGHDDVLIGAPRNDAGGEDAGRAWVRSGADGRVLLTLTGEEAGDQLGAEAAGWVGPDGTVLLAVGAPGAGPGDRGRTYVYRGLTPTPAFTIESDETGDALGGMFVSVVGDVDADGAPDIYASDWSNAARGPSTGRIYVHSGATGSRIHTLTGEAEGDGFGIGVADAGDVDGDGHDDLVVGAWQQGSLAPGGGKVYVHSGRDGSLLREITGKVMGETFGFDATGMGDVDGDGTPDFLLTSAWSSIRGPRSGRMYIVSGREPAAAVAPTGPDEEAIRALLRQTARANNEGDVEAWLDAFDPAAAYMASGMPAVTDREELREIAETGFHRWDAEIEITPVEITVSGRWAFARARVTGAVVSRSDGERISVDNKELIVFRKRPDGTWKIVRMMINPNR